MPRVASPLTALQVKALKTPGRHAVGGVPGLCLYVKDSGSRSWILRVKVGESRRDMGLGSYPEVSLQEARESALEHRRLIRQGEDPLALKSERKAALRAARLNAVTFSQVTDKFLAMKEQELSNSKHRKQWQTTIETYAYPEIGRIPVSEVALEHMVRILEPIWVTKTETAKRLRGRIEAVLDYARVSGYRSGDNPARWRGNLEAVLPNPGKVTTRKHHKAMPIDDLPDFFRVLQKRQGDSARALELVILTALRSGEVRGATWSEIDLENALWTIPALRNSGINEVIINRLSPYRTADHFARSCY